jgi:hemerythrin superfamily protein
MAVRAYIRSSARLVTTPANPINAASQPAADIVAFKRAAAPSLLSVSQFCGVPVTFLNRGFVQRKEGASIRCMATQKSLEVGADIIDKVKQDHKELEEAYSNYKKYHKEGNEEEAGKWFNQFVWEISRHAVTEELVLYPLIASQGEKGQKLADASRDDHQQTKNMLEEIQNIKDDDAFEKKFDEIMHVLREHISKEEKEDLVYLQQNVDQGGREAAGTTFALGKNIVPTKPHAGVPNKSAILEGALGLFTTPIDKLRDVFTPYPSAKDN